MLWSRFSSSGVICGIGKRVSATTGFPISMNIFSIPAGVIKQSMCAFSFVSLVNLCTGQLKGIFTYEPFVAVNTFSFVINLISPSII